MRTPPILLQTARIVLRYRLLHILFWVISYLSFVHELHIFQPHDPVIYLSALYPLLADMGAVYLTLYLLLPRFFRRQQYLAFFGLTFLSILLVCLGVSFLKQVIETGIQHRHPDPLLIVAISFMVDALIKVFLFGSVVIVYSWMRNTLKQRQIENERIRAELSFLKSQINPHFLLNTINNIYVLIDEDKQTASNMLIRFSELLRYQLYECNEGNNPIATELEFIRNFIGIEQLRLGDTVAVETKGMDELPYFEMAPFVLLPFVENAFKYVSRRPGGDNRIQIGTRAEGGVFYFTVTNTFDEHILPHTLPKPGGIGVSNVRRRLELIYPGRHSLELIRESDRHTVKLSIHV